MPGRMPQQIAVAFALCAFAVAVGAGLLSSQASATTLVRSIVVLLVAYPIGRVMGAVIETALNEHLTAVIASNPVPETVTVAPADPSGEVGEVDILDDVESV